MKNKILTFSLVYLLTGFSSPDPAITLKKALIAKLAYQAGDHQVAIENLRVIVLSHFDEKTYLQYLNSAVSLHQLKEALETTELLKQQHPNNGLIETASMMLALRLKAPWSQSIALKYPKLNYARVFDAWPKQDKIALIEAFYQPQAMNLPSARAFMIEILALTGMPEAAEQLFFVKIQTSNADLIQTAKILLPNDKLQKFLMLTHQATPKKDNAAWIGAFAQSKAFKKLQPKEQSILLAASDNPEVIEQLLNGGHVQQAAQLLDQTLASRSEKIYYLHVQLALVQGNYLKAKELLKNSSYRYTPYHALYQAKYYYELQQYQFAYDALLQQPAPELFFDYTMLKLAILVKLDPEMALKMSQELIGMIGFESELFYQHALALSELHRSHEALQVFKFIHKIDPSHQRAAQSIALLLAKQEGNSQEALAFFKAAMPQDQLETPEQMMTLAQLYALNKNSAEATYWAQQAFEQRPALKTTQEALEVFETMKKAKNISMVFERLEKIYPKDVLEFLRRKE